VFSISRPPPRSTLVPYTSLFRSAAVAGRRFRFASAGRRIVGVAAAGRRVLGVRGRLRTAGRRLRTAGGWRRPRRAARRGGAAGRSEEHTSELQSRENLVCRLLLE